MSIRKRRVAYIFPHSEDEEIFKEGTVDELRHWLIDPEEGLKSSDGEYYIRCKEPRPRRQDFLPFPLPTSIPAGSVVLFRFKGEIVGDAVVEEARRTTSAERRKLRDKNYTAYIKFDLKSIRLYPSGSVTDKDLKKIMGRIPNPREYPVLTFSQFKTILRKVAKQLVI